MVFKTAEGWEARQTFPIHTNKIKLSCARRKD
jgi:hypothetical protein